ncbi:MAG TPA: response regulator transcription factor [Steroidobacteraceae bacterium]|nr:response regulator transcription factor [Steroidobacteraceae bacterium]
MLRILIADDHPLFREALKGTVASSFEGSSVLEADSVGALQETLAATPDLDLLLLDLQMPGAVGFSALVHTRAHHPATPVVVISGTEDPGVMRRAVAHGAAGFIPKSANAATIRHAITTVLDGEVWLPPEARSGVGHSAVDDADIAGRVASLTHQQFRVLTMLAEGLLNKQIAWELKVSEATVKAHMTAIMKKLGVQNRTQAVLAVSGLTLTGELPLPPEDPDVD